MFAENWLASDCGPPISCGGADMDGSGQVDWSDFGMFAAHWLQCGNPEGAPLYPDARIRRSLTRIAPTWRLKQVERPPTRRAMLMK